MMAKAAIGIATAALAICASSGIASAEPNVDAIANSPCSYAQVMAALNDQSPAVAAELNGSALATGWLQNLIAAPPDQRRQMIAMLQGIPEVQEYTDVINQVAVSCENY